MREIERLFCFFSLLCDYFGVKEFETRVNQGVFLRVGKERYFIQSNFKTRVVLESFFNTENGLKGLERRGLSYFIEHYFDKTTEFPLELLKKLLLALIPNVDKKTLNSLKYDSCFELSSSIGFLMAECFGGGETAKKFLVHLVKKREYIMKMNCTSMSLN